MKRLLPLLVLASSCATPSMMRAVAYDRNENAKCLVVLLPGMGDKAEHFEKNGFVQALKRDGLSVNVIAANATQDYYLKGEMVSHLKADVLVPALARQRYQHVWLMGTSMGGFGSLMYAAQQEGEIDGVVALAPFLGEDIIKEVKNAGGVAQWQAPDKVPFSTSNYQQQLWRWVKEQSATPDKAPLIFTGWGSTDKLAEADALLATTIPQNRVFNTEGGHDWKTWSTLFNDFLAQGEFKKQCGQ